MNGWKLMNVYKMDGHLVIGHSLEDAIATFKLYINDNFYEIQNIELVTGDYLGLNKNAIIRDESTSSEEEQENNNQEQ